jgi:hypothetical protein
VRNVSLFVAIEVNNKGFREVLAVAEGSEEDKASWTVFLRPLKERGLHGLGLFVPDKCLGLVESLGEFIRERCGSAAEGRTSRGEAEGHETGRCRNTGRRWYRRDAVLLPASAREHWRSRKRRRWNGLYLFSYVAKHRHTSQCILKACNGEA